MRKAFILRKSQSSSAKMSSLNIFYRVTLGCWRWREDDIWGDRSKPACASFVAYPDPGSEEKTHTLFNPVCVSSTPISLVNEKVDFGSGGVFLSQLLTKSTSCLLCRCKQRTQLKAGSDSVATVAKLNCRSSKTHAADNAHYIILVHVHHWSPIKDARKVWSANDYAVVVLQTLSLQLCKWCGFGFATFKHGWQFHGNANMQSIL